MSYIRNTFEKNILAPINKIQIETLKNSDFSNILKYLNATIDICEEVNKSKPEIGALWNEIISDIIGAIHSVISGFYHNASVSLRSILELACNSFYYYDHQIESYLFQNHNLKSDKYVSTLVNDHLFFTTNYIKAFYSNIENEQTATDSISVYLKKIYGILCDIVHGRYKSLTKTIDLEIKYDKGLVKQFENNLINTLSIISVLFILRFDYKSNADLIELANYSKVVNFK